MSVLPSHEEVIKPSPNLEGTLFVGSDNEVRMESASLIELKVLHGDCDLSQGSCYESVILDTEGDLIDSRHNIFWVIITLG